MAHAFLSRNPRPGFVLYDDPMCCDVFGQPHYHEIPRVPAPTPPRAVRPQSLAQERYEQAWAQKQRLR